MAQSAGRRRVVQEIVGEQGMQVEDGVAFEADALGRVDQEFDRVLVVEDHLRFDVRTPFGFLSKSAPLKIFLFLQK